MTTNASLLELRKSAVPVGASNLCGVFVERAENATIYDVEGREYIDFVGGIGVNNVGHCNPRVVAAIKAQADKLLHSCFHVAMYEGYVTLADRLCALTPGSFPKKALFLNSGAEAVENAIKIARTATGRQAVIAFDTAFHGRTLLTMTLTSKIMPYKQGFGPFAPEVYRFPYAYCYRCPYGLKRESCGVACADKLEDFFLNNVAANNVAALLVEPVAGEGGFITPPAEFFHKLQAICEKHGIVFISDEIQTGMGRTGKLFAMEHHGMEPDMTLVAKSLGGGMPISAVTGRAELLDAVHPGGLGGTYGGNPVSCAAALAVLDIFASEPLLERGEALGKLLHERLGKLAQSVPQIGELRGLGPMFAVEFVEDRETRKPAKEKTQAIVKQCIENGLLILSCGNHGNVVRTLMPLTIGEAELERGLNILEQAIRTVCLGA
ncbi:MAG: 4-aminobutyrate--2-oxoglutarate transaminase [Desulfovibrio sp.]